MRRWRRRTRCCGPTPSQSGAAGKHLLIAGTNDDSHYYAAAELLHRWGCRWYLPTEFGECIPEKPTLTVGKLDYAYAPPFEVRNYWIAWNGSTDGQQEFTRRNFMNHGVGVPIGHAIGEYVKELIPKGKTVFNVPIAEDATAEHVAKKVAPKFAEGQGHLARHGGRRLQVRLAADKELQASLHDKYFLAPSLTDAFMTLYNKVAERLAEGAPRQQVEDRLPGLLEHHPAAAARRSSPRSRWSRTSRRSTSTRSTAWTTRSRRRGRSTGRCCTAGPR